MLTRFTNDVQAVITIAAVEAVAEATAGTEVPLATAAVVGAVVVANRTTTHSLKASTPHRRPARATDTTNTDADKRNPHYHLPTFSRLGSFVSFQYKENFICVLK